MNILILMAGNNAPFEEAGYSYPRNLVEIKGIPLVQRVLDSVKPFLKKGNRFICQIPAEENKKYYTGDVIQLLLKQTIIMEVGLTAGSACTALLAIEYINNNDPLLIVSGDQIIHDDLMAIVNYFQEQKWDGGIPIFKGVHPRWSYVKCASDGYVIETSEKRPISDLATAGVYYFSKGVDFVNAAMQMIYKDAHVNDRFYICPVYNQMILNQAKIGTYSISRDNYFKLSNPNEVQEYQAYLVSNIGN